MQVSVPPRARVRQTAERLEAMIRHLTRETGSDYLQAVEATGLSLTQVKALLLLAECGWSGEGPIPSNCLAERLRLSLAATSRALDGLARRRLVTRAEDPGDRRVRRVAIAGKGEALVEELVALRTAGLEEFVARLSPVKQRRLEAALESVMEDG